MAYKYLGKVAHDLADMTVPAHVHEDYHVPYIGWDRDQYEYSICKSPLFRYEWAYTQLANFGYSAPSGGWDVPPWDVLTLGGTQPGPFSWDFMTHQDPTPTQMLAESDIQPIPDMLTIAGVLSAKDNAGTYDADETSYDTNEKYNFPQVWYLMYYTNQVADWFASRDIDGDDVKITGPDYGGWPDDLTGEWGWWSSDHSGQYWVRQAMSKCYRQALASTPALYDLFRKTVDNVAPTVDAQFDGSMAKPSSGWYTSPVTVTLSATDAGNDSTSRAAGVYSFARGQIGGTALSPTGVTNSEGILTGVGKAADWCGNVGTKSFQLQIDTSAPSISADSLNTTYLTSERPVLRWTATDAVSGLEKTWATFDGEPIANGSALNLAAKAGVRNLDIYAEDVAGNVGHTRIQFEVLIDATFDSTDPVFVHPATTQGTLTCYIEFPTGYDVSKVDPSTVSMGLQNGQSIKALPTATTVKDYDKDGRRECPLKFRRGDFLAACAGKTGTVGVTLAGALRDGVRFATGTGSYFVVLDPSTVVPPRVP